jgi:hypothetical protein
LPNFGVNRLQFWPVVERDLFERRHFRQGCWNTVFTFNLKRTCRIPSHQRVQAGAGKVAVLKKHREMIGELGHGDLGFKNVLLRNPPYCVLDASRCDGLSRQSNLLIMEPQFVLIPKQFVERCPDSRGDIELPGFEFRFGNVHSLTCRFISQFAFPGSRERLVEHEHVLRLIHIPRGEYRSAPGAICKGRIVHSNRWRDSRFCQYDAFFHHSNFAIVL